RSSMRRRRTTRPSAVEGGPIECGIGNREQECECEAASPHSSCPFPFSIPHSPLSSPRDLLHLVRQILALLLDPLTPLEPDEPLDHDVGPERLLQVSAHAVDGLVGLD